jgi:cytochrome P450
VFDPFDAAQSRDAWPLLKQMRDDAPVVTIANGMRYVTRHAEARTVMREAGTFSNATGMKAPGVEIPAEDRLLGELDPPRHTAVRRVMVTAMSPKVVHAAEPFIAETARALLGALPADKFDLVGGFTVILPNRVTVYLLGFDPDDADQLAQWAKGLMESTFRP